MLKIDKTALHNAVLSIFSITFPIVYYNKSKAFY